VNANVVDVFSSTLQAEPHKSDQTAELADVSHLHNAPLITKSHSKFCTLGSVQTFGNNSWSQSNNCRQQLNLSCPPQFNEWLSHLKEKYRNNMVSVEYTNL